MLDNYVFTGKDGVSRTFVGDRPPTPAEMASLESAEAVGRPNADQQSSKGALVLAGAKASAPKATEMMADFATSPTAAKTMGALANKGTMLAGVAHGAATLNPAEVLAAPKAGWAAGKGGYWLGRTAQGMAGPIANMMEKAAPYIQSLSTMSGLQGGLDLAQVADPTRQDIGFLGMGSSNSNAAQFAARLDLKLKQLMDAGMSKADAYKALNEIVKASR